jgi:hypothetical protein
MNGYIGIIQHDAYGVEIVAMQEDRILRSDFDVIDIHILIVKHEMVMRLGAKRNHGRSLRARRKYKQSREHKESQDGFH